MGGHRGRSPTLAPHWSPSRAQVDRGAVCRRSTSKQQQQQQQQQRKKRPSQAPYFSICGSPKRRTRRWFDDPRLDSLAWLEMTIRGNCVPSRIGRRSDASQSGHRNHWTIRGNLARSNRGLFSTGYRLKKKRRSRGSCGSSS